LKSRTPEAYATLKKRAQHVVPLQDVGLVRTDMDGHGQDGRAGWMSEKRKVNSEKWKRKNEVVAARRE
jgi:hypothetical protein